MCQGAMVSPVDCFLLPALASPWKVNTISSGYSSTLLACRAMPLAAFWEKCIGCVFPFVLRFLSGMKCLLWTTYLCDTYGCLSYINLVTEPFPSLCLSIRRELVYIMVSESQRKLCSLTCVKCIENALLHLAWTPEIGKLVSLCSPLVQVQCSLYLSHYFTSSYCCLAMSIYHFNWFLMKRRVNGEGYWSWKEQCGLAV